MVALQNKTKYDVRIEDANEDSEISQNQLRKGIFKKFLVKLTTTGANLTYTKTSGIYVVPELIMLDTHTALEYHIFIGTNCSSQIEANVQFELKFAIEKGDDLEMFNQPNKVTVEFVSKTVSVYASAASKVIPSDSYAIYRTGESVRNVDNFTLNFTRESGDESIEVMRMKEYQGK